MTRYAGIEEITEEESLLRKEVHRFAEEVIRPASKEIDKMPPDEYQERITEKDSPYWEVVRKMRELGFHRGPIPEEFGGEGMSGSEIYTLIEEIAWGSSGLSIDLGVDLYPLIFAIMSSDEDLQENYVDPYLNDEKGEIHGCWAVTEPEHGSDFVQLNQFLKEGTDEEQQKWVLDRMSPGQVTAEKDGDEWIINGQKSAFLSAGPTATHAALHTDINFKERSPGRGFVVPLDKPGVTQGKPIVKLGQKDGLQGEIVFDNVRLSDEWMSLEPAMLNPNTGYAPITQILCITSSWMSASAAGLARAAFEEALQYSQERVQGGKPICEHQLVKKKLYDMFMKVETIRTYGKRIVEHVWERNFKKFEFDASYAHAVGAQVYCKEKAFEVAHDALQIHGGYGTTKDYLIEKLFRDARVKMIEDGTTDVLALDSADDLLDTC